MADEPLLKIENLTRVVRVNSSDKVIIKNISFNFEKCGIYNILGPSGAGKSSLLRLINRLDEPTSGRIVFKGKTTDEYSPCELRLDIGYLFQTPHLFEGTIRDNLLYANQSLTEDEMKELVTRVRIDTKPLDENIENLSIGEMQRVALGRLLATRPSIALLDEATSALDPANTEAIEAMIRQIAKEKCQTIIFVTHNPEQALRMGGKGLLLYNGELVEHGDVREIVNNPQSKAGQAYKNKEIT